MRISSYTVNRLRFYTNKVLELWYQNGHSNKVRRLIITAQPSGTTLVQSVWENGTESCWHFQALTVRVVCMYYASKNVSPIICLKKRIPVKFLHDPVILNESVWLRLR